MQIINKITSISCTTSLLHFQPAIFTTFYLGSALGSSDRDAWIWTVARRAERGMFPALRLTLLQSTRELIYMFESVFISMNLVMFGKLEGCLAHMHGFWICRLQLYTFDHNISSLTIDCRHFQCHSCLLTALMMGRLF